MVWCWLAETDEVIQDTPLGPIADEKKQEAEIQEVVCFLWDNYLQLWDSEHIFIMGVGNAYIGVKMLLLNRSDASPPGESLQHPAQPLSSSRSTVFVVAAIADAFPFCQDCRTKLAGVINFVDDKLRPVRSDVDETLAHWYRSNSRVFVSHDHSCWVEPSMERKIRKRRFGMVFRSPENTLAGMMRHHNDEVQQYILQRAAGGDGETTETEEVQGSRA